MDYQWYDLVGNLGVVFILSTYFLLQVEKISSQSLMYSLLNAIGAVAILISLAFKFNLSSFIIEVFWLIISVTGLMKVSRRKLMTKTADAERCS